MQTCKTYFKSPSLEALANYCVDVLKVQVYENGMSCALQKNSNGGFKRGQKESCSSTSKKTSHFCYYYAYYHQFLQGSDQP